MSDIYESPRILEEYLLFHYGREDQVLPESGGPRDAFGFPARSVTELLPAGAGGRALDVGCAVGRSSFELSRTCESVTGIDLSAAFIQAAETMRTAGHIFCRRHLEGNRYDEVILHLPGDVNPDRVRFRRGDAMDLPADLGVFDAVHAANLLCRLPDPARFLSRLPSLVHQDGVLILTTPCTWLESFTPRENWPPGSTFDWLTETLSPHFDLTRQKDLPFLIREHQRKYQWSLALGTVWRRR